MATPRNVTAETAVRRRYVEAVGVLRQVGTAELEAHGAYDLRTVCAVPGPEGFDYDARGGEVVITPPRPPRDRAARRLRPPASWPTSRTAHDEQELMARVTGNYRRGNERTAKNHPRNSGR